MIKKIDLFFFVICFFLFLFFILNKNTIYFANDSINYIKNALIIKNHLSNLNLLLNDTVLYPLLYSLILSFFLSQSDAINVFNCLENLEGCKIYFEYFTYFQSIFFFLTLITIFLIAQKLFNNKKVSYLSCLLFFLNSYYLSRIYFITPEVLSIFLFTTSFFFIVLYLDSKKYKFFIYFIIFSSFLFLLKPIFLIVNSIFFSFLFLFKKINFKNFIVAIIILSSFFSLSNYCKKLLFNNNNYQYEMTVIEQRTAYGFINHDEIIPLFISFIPKVGHNINNFLFDDEKIKRVKKSNNTRNYFYNNRDRLNNKLDSKLSLKEIAKKNIQNIDKQIMLIPVFLFRGLFMQGGYNDYYVYKDNEILIMIYVYFNYILFTLSKLYLLYITLKFSLSKVNSNLRVLLIYPLVVFLCHSVFTHNLPRYTSILVGIGAIFIIQKIYKIIIYYYKEKNA